MGNDNRFFFIRKIWSHARDTRWEGKFSIGLLAVRNLRFRVVQSVIFLYVKIWFASNYGNILITETSREVLVAIHKWCRLKCYLYLHKCKFKPQEASLKRIEDTFLTAKYSRCAYVICQKTQ